MVSPTYNELYKKGCAILSEITDCYEFETSQLFEHIFGEKYFLLPSGQIPDKNNADKFLHLCSLRCEGNPLQYLMGEWDFYGMTFKVGSGVLIPRADTEVIIDTALELCNRLNPLSIADLCSGSGAIAMALWDNLRHVEGLSIHAVELSKEAFPYLTYNIDKLSVGAYRCERVNAINGDALIPAFKSLDMVVSNPPYIPKHELGELSPEVKKEPVMALDGGQDGLDFYRGIISAYYPILSDNGAIIFECGYNQARDIEALLKAQGFKETSIRLDINKIERCVYGVK